MATILGGYEVELEDGCIVAARDTAGDAWTAETRPRIEVRDGFIVFAEDPHSQSTWVALSRDELAALSSSLPKGEPGTADRLRSWQSGFNYRRAAAHALVLGVALAPMSLNGASALNATAQPQERLQPKSIASSTGASTNILRDWNALEGEAPAPVAIASPPSAKPSPSSHGAPVAHGHAIVGRNGWYFPWGYCTWWVASKRNIPWGGNAIDWWPSARSMGFAEGSTPRVGAVMVTTESSVGHVAYVESVDPNGGFTVSEMNFRGFGVVSQRSFSSVPSFVVGFIY